LLEQEHAMSPIRWAVAAFLLLPVVAVAQQKEAPAEPPITVSLLVDAKWERRLAVARDYIEEKDWRQAVQLLQSALELPGDVLVNVKRPEKDGTKITTRVSLHDEAERILRGMPAEGIAFYRAAYKETAENLMKEARAKDSSDLYGRIAERYLLTEFGPGALELHAKGEFRAGHPSLAWRLRLGSEVEAGRPPSPGHLFRAARALDRLIAFHGKLEALSQQQLIMAAVVYRTIGDPAKIDAVWKVFDLKVAKEKLYLGDPRTVDQVRAETHASTNWPMLGGDPSRAGLTAGTMPYLGKVWEQSMFNEDSKGLARDWIRKALVALDDRKNAAISAFTPITVYADVPGKGRKQLMIYRSHWGIHAVDVRTGLMMWDADCPLSLEKMYAEPATLQAIDNWKQQYAAAGMLHVVLENSIIGSLTTDGERVYAVDDLPVPPYVSAFLNQWGRRGQFPWGAQVNDAMQYNVLQAFDTGTGMMRWKLGGRGARKNLNDPKSEMHDCWFLGPPLPLSGRLYAVYEKGKELRLAVIVPASGKVERIELLAKVRTPLLEDMIRRLHAAHAAYGDGILVCPTNAGALVGVDLRSLSIAWAFIYRDDKPPLRKDETPPDDLFRDDSPELLRFRRPNLGDLDEWKNTAPAVVNGKVVFTAPDSSYLHCLAVKDGSPLWKVDHKPGDLYLGGVYGDKALIVGQEKCRALNLADGQEAWSLVTGMPSGRGIAADGRYYLPLKSAADTRGPEVCVIDIAKGKIVAHARPSKMEPGKEDPAPGNLLFFEGKLLSQTPTRLVAYPELSAQLKTLDQTLKDNPRNPAALVERGQLLFDKGDLSKAVEDLRSALANKPDEKSQERARLVLFEALTELLLKDFNAPERDLKEYEELSKVELTTTDKAEWQRRRGMYFRVVGHGFERIGKPVEALRAYLDFAATASPSELVPAPDDPNVRVSPEAWARGQISSLLDRATPEQRKLLEEEIEKRLKK
jgi:outer membrane protein assembly factor BamB/tetratricopeptide (TPR) repeat protein